MNPHVPTLLVALLLTAAACAPAPKAKGAAGAAEEEATYQYGIGPEDVLQIDVWKRAELSREVTVRPDGYVSLPLVNDVAVTGLTSTEAAQVLKDRFKEFVADPEITVTVKASNSYRIYVVGKVNKPGNFTAKSPVTVIQAIATSGGFTPFASTSGIVILRRTRAGEVRLPFDYDAVVRGSKPEQNVVLQPGDTVIVP
jgi:polysaccharide export outer membrane protein